MTDELAPVDGEVRTEGVALLLFELLSDLDLR